MSAITEIGPWSEIKIEIIKKYAKAYSEILVGQGYLNHFYIDAFSGAGIHISRNTGEEVSGSAKVALEVDPPFKGYYFIDLDKSKTNILAGLENMRPGKVFIMQGDCNEVLIRDILPQMTFEKYNRVLCLLDPYGLHLDWKLIHKCGQLETVDLFLNFPVMDMNMNVLKTNKDKVDPRQAERMTRFWGDESWKEAAYTSEEYLLDGLQDKTSNEAVALAFAERLKNVAGFKNVVKPLPMRNSMNSIVYYLFFASKNKTANKIINDIFNKYR